MPPKHDAGTATRHYRAFWQRRCRAAAAGAVLKPLGGNCAVLPYIICGGELFVDRRSKSITISTVAAALQKIATRQAAGEAITGPKKIGCYGASYLYPMF